MKLKTIMIIFFLFIPCFSLAQSKVIMVTDPWPPFINVDETEKKVTGGISIKVVRKIFERIKGVEVEFKILPWKRSLEEVRHGISDGIPLLHKTPEREKYMLYTEPWCESRTVFFYRPSRYPNGIHWNTYKDLAVYTIGAVRGHSSSEKLKKYAAETGVKIRINEVTSDKQLFEMLLGNRIDLVLNNEILGYALIKKNGWQGKTITAKKSFSSSFFYIAFSKKTEAKKYIPRINNSILELKSEGIIEKILKSK